MSNIIGKPLTQQIKDRFGCDSDDNTYKKYVKLDIDCWSKSNLKISYNQPDNWVTPRLDFNSDEPHIELVENPRERSSFSFRSAFKSIKKGEKKYKHHCLTLGCVPVPEDTNSQRKIDD